VLQEAFRAIDGLRNGPYQIERICHVQRQFLRMALFENVATLSNLCTTILTCAINFYNLIARVNRRRSLLSLLTVLIDFIERVVELRAASASTGCRSVASMCEHALVRTKRRE
jgi:hypothetical protein